MLVLNVGNVVGTNLRGKSKMLDTTWPQKGGLPPDVTAPPHTHTHTHTHIHTSVGSHLCAAGLDVFTSLAELAWKSSLSNAIGSPAPPLLRSAKPNRQPSCVT